jgi:glutamate dehydrogenase
MFAYEDLMATLESADLLDRVAEELPSTEEMTERRRAGLGMQRAELAILFRGAETHLAHAVEASSVGDEPFLERDLRRYFPPTVVTRYGHLLGELPQRRQLIAAINGHLVVNTLGPTFVSRLMTELGAEPHDVVRAYRIAREVTGAEARRDEIEQLGDSVPADATAELTGALDTLEESVTRWYLLHPRTDMQRTVNAGTEAFEWLVQDVPDVAPESWRERWAETAGALVDKGVPEDLASAQALQPQLLQVPDMVAVSQHTARGIDEVARMLFLCGEHLLIDSLEARLASLPATSRAQAWAIQVARDDARNARSEVAQRALAAAHDAPVDAAFARFQASQSEAIQRLEAFIGALAADGSDDLAGLTLAVRHVRALGGMRRGYAPTKSGPRVRENVV